jgi:hypothetical protein
MARRRATAAAPPPHAPRARRGTRSLISLFAVIAAAAAAVSAAAATPPKALADVAAFAACLSDDACVDASFTALDASHLAAAAAAPPAAAPPPAQPSSPPALLPSARVVAHCVAGQVRTFSKQTVYEALAAHVMAPLAAAGYQSDFFAHWGKGDNGNEMRAANTAGWAAALSLFTVVGGSLASAGDQRTKLDACYAQIVAAEARHGKTYSHVFRSRPDLFWMRPLPPSLPAAADAAVYLQYDLVGLCPRGAVAPDWPCDVPNAAGPTAVGPRNYPAVPNTTSVFQYLFERVNEPIAQLERHFEWVVWCVRCVCVRARANAVFCMRMQMCISRALPHLSFFFISFRFRGGLVEYARKARDKGAPFPPPRHIHAILLNFYAAICFKYDYHLHNWAYYKSPTLSDFTPAYSTTCPAPELNGSPYIKALNAVGDMSKLEAALNEMYFGPVQGHFVQHDASAPPGPNPPLDTLCGCRWSLCSRPGLSDADAGARLGLSADALALTRALCRHAFANPLNARAYYYHPPALHPQFDERDFLNASFADSMDTPEDRLAAAAAVAEAAAERGARAAAAPPPPVGASSHLKIAVLIVGQMHAGNENAVVLESIRSRLLDPYRRTHGHTVDVYLCDELTLSDTASKLVLQRLQPYSVLNVPIAAAAEDRHNGGEMGTASLARARACYAALPGDKRDSYDWVIRTRPDLILWDAAPDPNALNRSAVGARLFAAARLNGPAFANWTVKPGTLAAAFGDADCNGGACVPGTCAPADAPCILWDEALNFVPRPQLRAYFDAPSETPAATSAAPGACAWPASNGPEGGFTRAVLAGGGAFAPLTLEARLFMYKGDVPDESMRDAPKKC